MVWNEVHHSFEWHILWLFFVKYEACIPHDHLLPFLNIEQTKISDLKHTSGSFMPLLHCHKRVINFLIVLIYYIFKRCHLSLRKAEWWGYGTLSLLYFAIFLGPVITWKPKMFKLLSNVISLQNKLLVFAFGNLDQVSSWGVHHQFETLRRDGHHLLLYKEHWTTSINLCQSPNILPSSRNVRASKKPH